MLYMYIHLRYYRQLNKICPKELAVFFSEISQSVKNNGGFETSIPGGFLYSFTSESVGYVFAASRVIIDTKNILEIHKNRIREYTIIVESLESLVPADFFVDHIHSFSKIKMPDNGILFTTDALQILSSYCSTVPLAETPFFSYTGTKLVPFDNVFAGKNIQETPFTLYLDSIQNPILALLEMISATNFVDEKFENYSAVKVFKSFRFETVQDSYREEACSSYCSFIFQSWEKQYGLPAKIQLIGKTIPASLRQILTPTFCESCVLLEPQPSMYAITDLKNMPKDLLDLTYLLYRSTSLILFDELPAFFASLGRTSGFVVSLGDWLFSFGILSDRYDLRSLNRSLFPKICSIIGESSKTLDKIIAHFLWNSYQSGSLQPVFSLYEILLELGMVAPDSFLINCLYHSESLSETAIHISKLLSNSNLADTVCALEKAETLFLNGKFDDALILVKNSLHCYQKEKVLSGEYYALILMARLSLLRKKGAESVSYLEYALENAERLHDVHFRIITLFDISILQFLNGNYINAEITLNSLSILIHENFLLDKEPACLFLKGRIAFELGKYKLSSELFLDAQKIGLKTLGDECSLLCSIWHARCLVYLYRFSQAQEILIESISKIPEALLFLLESSILSGRRIADFSFPENIESLFEAKVTFDMRIFSWKSGFASIEDRVSGPLPMTRHPVKMYVFLRIFYSLYIEKSGLNDEFIQLGELSRAASDVCDSTTSLYCYLSYLAGTECFSQIHPDSMSFLSRGFKSLQTRSLSISDMAVREEYMQNPVWNSKLYKSARENKLI